MVRTGSKERTECTHSTSIRVLVHGVPAAAFASPLETHHKDVCMSMLHTWVSSIC
jgi:hypothetical protein